MSKLKFERLSEHLSTNTFKKKIIKSEAIENYLQYTFRTNRGVNIENKK